MIWLQFVYCNTFAGTNQRARKVKKKKKIYFKRNVRLAFIFT